MKKALLTKENIEQDIIASIKSPKRITNNVRIKHYVFALIVFFAVVIVGYLYLNELTYSREIALVFIAVISLLWLMFRYIRTKNVSADDYLIGRDTVSHIHEEKYQYHPRGAIVSREKTIRTIHFESGASWCIPKEAYLWSAEFTMSDVSVFDSTHKGNSFITVSDKNSGEVVVAYNENFFDYKE